MRIGRAIAVAATVLGVAVMALAWGPALEAQQDKQSQAAAAAAPQTSGQQQKEAVASQARPGEQKIIVKVEKKPGGQPEIVTIERALDVAAAGGGPRLGVQIRDVETAEVTKLKLTGPNGVVIEDVTKDSAADKAGAKTGDVVVQFDGENVRSARQLTRLVRETPAGRAVKMALMRDGKRMELSVTPEKTELDVNAFLPNAEVLRERVERGLDEAAPMIRQYQFDRRVLPQGESPRMPAPPPPGEPGPMMRQFRFRNVPPGAPRFGFDDGAMGMAFGNRGRLGVTVQELESQLADYFGTKNGLLVSTVRQDSPAAKAGIKAGDVITSINDKPVATSGELVGQLRDKEGDVTIGLVRDKKPMTLKATLDAARPPARRAPASGGPA